MQLFCRFAFGKNFASSLRSLVSTKGFTLGSLVLLFCLSGSAAETGGNVRPLVTSAKATDVGAKPKVKSNGVAATVRTDGAMVYAKPDFDSDVLATLKQNEKVRVSDGTTGDFAKFHKVRAGVVLGYIAEIDVQVEGAAKKRDHQRGAGKDKTKLADGKPKDDKPAKKKFKEENLPILFTKYIGLLIGTSEFAESINGIDAKDNLLMYGLKITGPDVLLSGPIMDVNIAFHYGAPSYYAALAAPSTKPSGFIIQADTLLVLPFFQRDTVAGTFGVGPMIKFSSIGITSGSDPRSLTELDLGLSLSGGFAFKIYKFALRLEGKYLIEKRTERMFQLGLQQQF